MKDQILRVEKLYNFRLAEALQRKTDLLSYRQQEEDLVFEGVNLKKVEAALSTLVNLVYGDSVSSLTEVLNYGIRAAYPREVTAVVEKTITAGRPALHIGLQDGGEEPVNPESAHGGGLAQILGFLARVILILAVGNRRLLILDETFSAVSGDLLSSLSELIRAIVTELDFQIILISHQPVLAEASHLSYRLTGPGELEEMESSWSV